MTHAQRSALTLVLDCLSQLDHLNAQIRATTNIKDRDALTFQRNRFFGAVGRAAYAANCDQTLAVIIRTRVEMDVDTPEQRSTCCTHSHCTTYTTDPSGLCEGHR